MGMSLASLTPLRRPWMSVTNFMVIHPIVNTYCSKPQIWASCWRYIKSLEIIKLIRIHHLGTMNVSSISCANQSIRRGYIQYLCWWCYIKSQRITGINIYVLLSMNVCKISWESMTWLWHFSADKLTSLFLDRCYWNS